MVPVFFAGWRFIAIESTILKHAECLLTLVNEISYAIHSLQN